MPGAQPAAPEFLPGGWAPERRMRLQKLHELRHGRHVPGLLRPGDDDGILSLQHPCQFLALQAEGLRGVGE